MKPSLVKGARIMCENDHLVGVVNRDVYKGETGYFDAVDYSPHQRVAQRGDPLPLKCLCGGTYLKLTKFEKVLPPLPEAQVHH